MKAVCSAEQGDAQHTEGFLVTLGTDPSPSKEGTSATFPFEPCPELLVQHLPAVNHSSNANNCGCSTGTGWDLGCAGDAGDTVILRMQHCQLGKATTLVCFLPHPGRFCGQCHGDLSKALHAFESQLLSCHSVCCFK